MNLCDVQVNFSQVINALCEATLVFDGQGKIVCVNPSVTTVLGYSAGELIGQSIQMLVPSSFRQTHAAHFQQGGAMVSHRTPEMLMTLKAVKKDGETLPVDISFSPFQIHGQAYVILIIRENSAILNAYEETLAGWSRAMDFRDKETENHTQRVTELSVRMAQAMALSEMEVTHIRWGALLHDIGKIAIPDQILNKPGPLTAEEWVEMRRHPEYAYEMLAPIQFLRPALDIPHCHHERWDGSGYPRGLKEEEIPVAARIFAVADVWDALTSDRPYRKALTPMAALRYIRENKGILFDPVVVSVFLEIIQTEENFTRSGNPDMEESE